MFFKSSQSTDSEQLKIKALEEENLRLRREHELLMKVKQVADMRSDYTEEQARYQRKVRAQWFSSSETIDEIRQNLARSAEAMDHQRSEVQESVSEVDRMSGNLMSLADKLSAIESRSGEVATSVGGLKEVASGISNFVGLIKSISEQTNLLALNAAIEAARAGEQGRGFAVVADEVRALAQRSADATSEIGDLISTIATEVDKVSDGIEEVGQQGQVLAAEAGTLSADVKTIGDVSHRVSDTFLEVANDSFIQTVKLDHVVWKSNIYNRIWNGDTDETPVTDHTECRLGKWYYEGRGSVTYQDLPAFRQLEEPHMRVHSGGIDALKEFRSGNDAACLASIETMEKSSKTVIRMLSELEADMRKRDILSEGD